MEIIQQFKARGAQVRATIKLIEEGGRNASRGKEKVMTYFRGTTVETTIISRGTTVETTTKQMEILQEQVTYHKNTYNQSPAVDDVGEATSIFVLNEDIPTLLSDL